MTSDLVFSMAPENMTPEDQLCLLLARGQLSPEVRARTLEMLATPVQWPLILERANTHQVYPLLYRNLQDLGFHSVPEAVQSELKGLFLANALRNQLLAEELTRLLRLLGEAGIRVIPLKGVALALSLYGDTAARVCSDIDILVPPEDVVRTIDLLLEAGYRTDFDDPFFSGLELRHGRHYGLWREGRGTSLVVEVHWQLVQYSSKNDQAVADLWTEARPQTCFGVPSFSFSSEWEPLYLSVHAADHEWEMLRWLVDIHQLASGGAIDWQRTVAKADQFELGLLTRQTLAVCTLLLGTLLPAGMAPAQLPRGVRIFPQPPVPKETQEAAFAFGHLRVLTRRLDKLRYVASIVFVPKLTDRDFVRLPASLAFLYYFIRPVRLVYKWVRRTLTPG